MYNEIRYQGPPGTGKTTKLAAWVQATIAKHGAESVFVSSLTRSAAHELRARDIPLERDQLGTLHSICYQALGRPKLVVGNKDVEQWNEFVESKNPEFRRVSNIDHQDLGVSSSAQYIGDKLFAEIDVYRSRREPVSTWSSDRQRFLSIVVVLENEPNGRSSRLY